MEYVFEMKRANTYLSSICNDVSTDGKCIKELCPLFNCGCCV